MDLRELLEKNIKIIEHYVVKAQIPVWIEEMSELTKALCKWSRIYDKLEGDIDSNLLNALKEEIADVTVCIDQLRYMIQYDERELMEQYKNKVERQIKRIEDEK